MKFSDVFDLENATVIWYYPHSPNPEKEDPCLYNPEEDKRFDFYTLKNGKVVESSFSSEDGKNFPVAVFQANAIGMVVAYTNLKNKVELRVPESRLCIEKYKRLSEFKDTVIPVGTEIKQLHIWEGNLKIQCVGSNGEMQEHTMQFVNNEQFPPVDVEEGIFWPTH